MGVRPGFNGTYGATISGRLTAMRIVQRPNGGFLAVYERDRAEHESRTPQLIIEIGRKQVWLTTFPADWYQLNDDQLVALART